MHRCLDNAATQPDCRRQGDRGFQKAHTQVLSVRVSAAMRRWTVTSANATRLRLPQQTARALPDVTRDVTGRTGHREAA
jgi:hypothetical protein